MFKLTALAMILAGAISVAATGAATAEDQLSGTVKIESTSVALGIGVSWGDGELTYEGKVYHFSVSGLSVVDLGISEVSAAGEVYNLHNLDDFNGNYVAGEAGAAAGGGVAIAHLKNQNGVVIKLKSTQTGIKLTLAAEGMDVSLK